MKQSRLNNFLPLLCVSIPCKMRSYHSSAAQSCPLTLLYFKGMITTLKVLERAIQKAKGIKSACYLCCDFVYICHLIPFNLSFEFKVWRYSVIQAQVLKLCSLPSKNFFDFNINIASLRRTRPSPMLSLISHLMQDICCIVQLPWARILWAGTCYSGSDGPKCEWPARSQGWLLAKILGCLCAALLGWQLFPFLWDPSSSSAIFIPPGMRSCCRVVPVLRHLQVTQCSELQS